MKLDGKCESCGKGGSEVMLLFRLSKKVCICDGCVEYCRDLIGERRIIAYGNGRHSLVETSTEAKS